MGGLFKTFGPLELSRGTEGVDEAAVRNLFSSAGNVAKGLSEAIGVYILARQTVNGPPLPWYVGMTLKGFRKRFEQHSKMKKSFGDVSKIPEGGKLVVFFMVLVSDKTGKFQKPSRTSNKVLSIDALEDRLVGTCLSLNKDLLNTSKKTLNEGLRVPGYLNDKAIQRDVSASALAEMLAII